MAAEFIYSIENIFALEKDSVFHVTKTEQFYIGPYQRSYKWQSAGEFDQVPQLLNDIYEAMCSKGDEYFLQYITVKANNTRKWLEVIDGQQRLTTLSLLFYQLGEFGKENIAKGKLIYSRYDGVNIFDEVCDELKSGVSSFNEQDMFYMVAASRCIHNKLTEWQKAGVLDKFCDYLLYNVKIIVNIESNFVKSEDIFANLNDNHVPLTDAYLIKGLLITNAVSRVNAFGRTLEYSEIQEKRKALGRLWDEMLTWITNKEHCHFFFKNTELGKKYNPQYCMEYLLEYAFLYKYPQYRDKAICEYGSKRLELFNRYNSMIKSTEESFAMIEAIKHIYRKMVSVYNGPLYNLWGYMQFSKPLANGSEDDKLDIFEFPDMSESKLRNCLKAKIKKRIPNLECQDIAENNYESLRYRSRNDRLTNLLLSFSVFLSMKESADFRFGFYEFDNNKWSFEHISPQNPKGDVSIPDYAKSYVIKEIEKQIEDKGISEDKKKELNGLKESIMNGKKVDSALLPFLYDFNVDEHSLGNMALLSREDNSANNNNPFMVKKLIIQNRKGCGAFIPRHTYDAFNKILVSPSEDESFSAELFIWTQQDIDAHIMWMKKSNDEILEWLRND